MKARLFAVFILVVGLGLLLTWAVVAQMSDPRTLLPGGSISALYPTPTSTAPITWQVSQEDLRRNRQTILLWPKELSQFMKGYSSWAMWLGSRRIAPYSVRDELLVSVRAIATMIPDLEVGTDEPDSDLIIVSGNPAAIGALSACRTDRSACRTDRLDRLRDHPLLARVTEDSPARRDEARTAWVKSRFDRNYDTSQGLPASGVNIRNNWVTNVVWGYSTPGATICVTLTRSSSHVLTTTTTANPEGLYHAYLIWEIRDGDVIEVNDGTGIKTVSVIPLRASGDAFTALVTGLVPSVPEVPEKISGAPPSLEVTVGKASRSVIADSRGMFTADFSDKPFRPGTRGFLRYTDSEENRIFIAFGVSIVNVRRDTSYGRPYGDTHSAGISSIVWGGATPSATLIVTLTRPSTFVVTRTLTADQVGDFSVSVDRLIEDGDIVEVFDGADVRTVQVPTMTFHADPVTRVITGTAPVGIRTTEPGAPHSLEIAIGGNTRQVTTTVTGEFSADFTANPYLAGLLGALCYTTPDGNRVYKPLFVADPLVRGKLGDWRADVILGQPDFSQITPNEVVSNRLFNPGGVYVDQSVQPNRVYVYDGGNSRVLGLSHLGICQAGVNAGQNCTMDSDCPGSICPIQETRPADVVLGQPSFNTSACNGDSSYQMYPDVPMASAETLCGLREEQMSPGEGGSGATMATDAQGNLYVPDFYNNRVLRYDNPFTTDAIADYVWGQADFSGIACNRGAGFYSHSDSKSLCLAPPPGGDNLTAGVALDSAGNLWVADNMNNRLLRFPFNPTLGRPVDEADLVLGQPDLSTITQGAGLQQMNQPASVRVDSRGVVYVADSHNNRVLMFEPPLSNGMPATYVFGGDLREVSGLELDTTGGLWVNNSLDYRFIHLVDGAVLEVIDSYDGRALGGLGVDQDGNLLTVGWDTQEGLHFSPPMYVLDSRFLRSVPEPEFNQTGSRGIRGGTGLEVAAGQLIYADQTRMVFWNNPWNLTKYQAADGVVGQPDFQSRTAWGPYFRRMRADDKGRLWVIHLGAWQGFWPPAEIYGYQLPLKTAVTPDRIITSPLPLQGGGVFTWTWTLSESGIDVQPDCDCLWVSDEENHRAFRIRNVSTQPVVDVVLGQLDASGTQCNQGRGRDLPSRDSLCHPGALAFDQDGNLYVADHNSEFDGNFRLLEFDANTIPDAPTSAVFGILATRVFGRNGDFTEPDCLPPEQDPMCGPWEPAFDSPGRMVIGFNGYLGPRFPMVYQDPLTNPLPIAALGDLHSMPDSARFDQFDNLYILDHNRGRILIYRNREVQTYVVTGAIKTASGDPIPGVQVETTSYASSGLSDASGAYTLTGVVTGTYELVPSKNHYVFTPVTRTVSVPQVTVNQNFVGTYVPTTAAFIAPSPGATVFEVVTVTVESTGDWVELYLDSVLHSKTSPQPASWSWSTRQVANGLHTLRAVPYDDEGRVGTPHVVTVTVNNAPSTTPWLLAGLTGLTVADLAVAPSDRQVLYAATETGGVYKTFDGSMFWTAVNNDLPAGANLSSLAISPNNSQVVYVGSRSGGVYKTTNGGNSWSSAGLDAVVEDLAIASTDEQILYAVGSDVYQTVDGGNSWTPVLANGWFRSVAIDPLDAQIAYVGEDQPSFSGAIYKTTDGGTSWETQAVGTLSGLVQTILVDPYDTDTLYVGKLWGPGGVYKSTNGGLSWQRTGLESGVNTESLAMAPSNRQVLYAGDGWGGVYETSNGGTTWASVSDGLPPGVAVSALAVDLSYPAIVYAGLNNGGVWKTAYIAPTATPTNTPTPTPTNTPTSTPTPTPTNTPTSTPTPNRLYLPIIMKGTMRQ